MTSQYVSTNTVKIKHNYRWPAIAKAIIYYRKYNEPIRKSIERVETAIINLLTAAA